MVHRSFLFSDICTYVCNCLPMSAHKNWLSILDISCHISILTWHKQTTWHSVALYWNRQGYCKKQGWYNDRRRFQSVFVIILFTLSLASIALIWWILRKQWHKFLFPLTGFLLLVSFILIRATSFHHVDRFLKTGPSCVRMNWTLELEEIGWVMTSAAYRLKKIGEENSKSEIWNSKPEEKCTKQTGE